MKTTKAVRAVEVLKTGLSHSVNAKQWWDRVPAWLQSELMVIASIIRNPDRLEEIAPDINPAGFFQPESEASVEALLSHYDATGQVIGWDELQEKLKGVPWLKASEIELHMGLLRAAPVICEGHLVNTILWFTTGRRVFRGLSDAVEAMADQDMGWQNAMSYLFQAIDLPHLKEDDFLGRIQAAVLKLDTCAHDLKYCPKAWEDHLQLDDGTADLVGIKILSDLVQVYVESRSHDALPSFTADSPEFAGVTPAEAKAALKKLSRAGLVDISRSTRFPLGAGIREGGEGVLLLRPTAKALIPLLKADDKQASLDQPGSPC